MKKILEFTVSSLFNWFYSLLKNHTKSNFSREEIRYFKPYFSQFGEDIAVLRWADKLNTKSGTYLDIGAFHPTFLSNTLLLYQRGWSGINIDMNPQKIELFKSLRSRDENLCCAISDQEDESYVIENVGRATEKIRKIKPAENLAEKQVICSKNLQKILNNSFLANRGIDYVNIDCEGLDLDVLKQINFEIHQPSIITIEALDMIAQKKICQFLFEKGYCLSEKIHWTLLFTSSELAQHETYISADMFD